jgi:hypothetical protein
LGDFRNKFDSDLIGDIPLLKNLKILRIVCPSPSLLAANLKVKLKDLNCGPLNKSSKLGFTI